MTCRASSASTSASRSPPDRKSDVVDALRWALWLGLAIAIMAAAMFALRRWFFLSRQKQSEPPWSLQHLRDLRTRGQITESEFQQLRDQMLGQAASRKDGPA